jgi:class 3 adenylate cyclase/tetratricopeptide (TPR) repeat protein
VEAERRQVTVLFTDMVGFTAFSEKSGEEAAFTLMRSLSKLMDDAVREQGGVVQGFTGDGIMAVFGAPGALEDAPLRACRAALSILQRLKTAGSDLEAKHGVRPQVRIGLNTGPAVVGSVQSGANAGVTVLGDTVNVAARFQALAEPGSACMTESTYRLVQGMVEAAFVGEHLIKGKSELQTGYRLDAIRHGAARFDAALSRGLTTYVGRDRELETLERRLAETSTGIKLIDIAGEPGIGKSRLLHEFRQRIGESSAFILSGSCSPENQQTPFLPFIEVVRGSFRVTAGEDQAAVARKLDDDLKVLGLASAQNLGLLLNLLGLKAPEGLLQGLDGALIGFRTRDLIRQLLRARCRLSRGVIAIEDLHWIDSASEELLGEIVASAEPLPLMIVHTRRPEYHPPWSEQPNVSHVPLEPLSARETARIVEARFGGDKLPEELRRLVAGKAEGNALFAEELVSFLLERSFVRREAGGLVFDAATVASALPASVQSLLTARVDRLAPADRALLQAAAVIGRRFDSDLLAVVTGAGGDVGRSLAAMQALDLVHSEDKTGDYIFKHALVRDAVYSSLLNTARSMLHLKIADEIERRSANHLPKVAETLAYHYVSTTRADKAFLYLAMAAKKCLDIHSLDEADRYARQALDLLASNPSCADDLAIADVMVDHLHILYEKSDFLEIKRVAELYLPQLEAMGDTAQLVFAMYFHALGLAGRNEFSAGEALSRKALEVAERIGDLKAKSYAMNGILHTSAFLARHPLEIMERMGAECLALSRSVGDNSALNYAYWNVAMDYAFRGLMREAREGALKLLDAGREREDRRALGIAHTALATINLMIGNFREAVRHSDECLRTALTPYERRMGAIIKASAEIFLGDVQGGLVRLLEAVNVASETSWGQAVAFGTISVGVGHVLAGRIGRGIGLLESAITAYDGRGDILYATLTRIPLAEIYLEMLTSRARPPVSVILRNLRMVLRVKFSGVRRIKALLEQAGRAPHLHECGASRARINMNIGLVHKLKKEPDLARQFLEKARGPAEHHGATLLVAKIDAALAELQ